MYPKAHPGDICFNSQMVENGHRHSFWMRVERFWGHSPNQQWEGVHVAVVPLPPPAVMDALQMDFPDNSFDLVWVCPLSSVLFFGLNSNYKTCEN